MLATRGTHQTWTVFFVRAPFARVVCKNDTLGQKHPDISFRLLLRPFLSGVITNAKKIISGFCRYYKISHYLISIPLSSP